MKEIFPFKKLLKLAIITSFLFGLFRATPFIINEQIYASRHVLVFTSQTLLAFLFWIVNIGLLYFIDGSKMQKHIWIRYVLSIFICGSIAVLYFRLTYDWQFNLRPPARGGIFPEPGIGNRFPDSRGILFFQKRGIYMPAIQSVSVNFIILILQDLILIKDKKTKIENEYSQHRIANLEARHSLLKQQLQPHFLFNSLSTLRSLIKRQSEQAEEYVVSLSEMLRYSINSKNEPLISIHDEIEVCKNYLAMQKVRFGEALQFLVKVPDHLQYAGKVPAFSLQLLVENAVKHNKLTVHEPLHIEIAAKDFEELTVTNNLQRKGSNQKTSNFGLKNLAERYKLFCNEDIQIFNDGKIFVVTIKIIKS